jgi:hypothetical protein
MKYIRICGIFLLVFAISSCSEEDFSVSSIDQNETTVLPPVASENNFASEESLPKPEHTGFPQHDVVEVFSSGAAEYLFAQDYRYSLQRTRVDSVSFYLYKESNGQWEKVDVNFVNLAEASSTQLFQEIENGLKFLPLLWSSYFGLTWNTFQNKLKDVCCKGCFG